MLLPEMVGKLPERFRKKRNSAVRAGQWAGFSRARADESLVTSRVSSSMRSGSNRLLPIWRSSTLTAVRPSSASGWRTVVSAGTATVASTVSSKPTTEQSPGTVSPRAAASCMTPMAMLSLNAKIAVGGSGQVKQRSRLLAAAVDAEVRVADEGIVRQDAGAGQRRVVAAQPFLRRDPAPRSADHADPPVPEAQQVPGRLRGTGGVRGADDGDAVGNLGVRIHHHEREAVRRERPQLSGGFLGQHQDRPVGIAADQPLEQGGLPLVRVPGRAEHGPQAVLVERFRHAGQDLARSSRDAPAAS